jgi:hypothetical protein
MFGRAMAWEEVPQEVRGEFGKVINLPDGSERKCNVVAMLENVETGSKRIIRGHNIVTTLGDQYYASKACSSSPSWPVLGIRLGSNFVVGSKGSTDVKSYIATTAHSLDAAYPKVSDPDTDNTSGGITVATWRVSFLTTEANVSSIAEFSFVDSISTTPTKALNHALFDAVFTKTSADTLKVFANHVMLGS